MSYNNYMYAIDRSDKYLEHYGIKGMKWGVRKALERGDARSINRHFRKAQRKLVRLQKRATNGKKYARRAALMGTGALATGALTVGGVEGLGNALNVVGRRGHGVINRVIKPSFRKDYGQAFSSKMLEGRQRLSDWAQQKPLEARANALGKKMRDDATHRIWGVKSYPAGETASDRVNEYMKTYNKSKKVEGIGQLNNAKLLRAGSALATAGLAAGAGYNAYRAATTKRAARKAAEWEKAMRETFGTTGSTNKRARTKRHKR